MNGMEYIRRSYGVPAYRGGRIKYMGKIGTIISSRYGFIRVRFDGQKKHQYCIQNVEQSIYKNEEHIMTACNTCKGVGRLLIQKCCQIGVDGRCCGDPYDDVVACPACCGPGKDEPAADHEPEEVSV